MRSTLIVITIAALVANACQSQALAEDGIAENFDSPAALLNFEEPEQVFTNYSNGLASGCPSGDCCGSCSSCSKPFGSDRAFEGFIEPVTNLVFFEDPRAMTRVRFFFMNQMIPENSVLRGGDLQVYGAQVSVALNERFALLANKDGYMSLQPDSQASTDGWADIATGFKYVFIRDTSNQFLVSGGILYEWSQGSADVFQGNGDGMWNFFLTTGKEFADGKMHFIGTVGWHLPSNGNKESESMFYSVHLDYMLSQKLYAIWELTGTEYVDSGRAIPGLNHEGGDMINLGAGNVTGNHVINTAFGFTYKATETINYGAVYEFPLTNRDDLLDNRTTLFVSLYY